MSTNNLEIKKKIDWIYFLHLAIGFGFMFVFPHLGPFEPITSIGMTVLGTFIAMVYFYSTLSSVWPTLLGLLVIALSGYLGDEIVGSKAVIKVFLDAFGSDTVMVTMLGMFLFGAMAYVGCAKYMARWFMGIKLLEGRPYVFLFIFFFSSYFVAGFCGPLASMLLLWPIALEIAEKFGYKVRDKVVNVLVCGVYLASTLGQPMLPFKGAQYVIISAFTKITNLGINNLGYIIFNVIMSIILLICFLVCVKFIYKPDVEGFKQLSISDLTAEKLPKMNIQQKGFFAIVAFYVLALCLPQFFPNVIGMGFFAKLSTLGVTALCVVIMMIIKFEGKPMLDLPRVAKANFSWDVLFLVAGALYACNALTVNELGIKAWLVQILNPLLGGRPEWMFVLFLLTFAIITTNFANNAGMAVVLLPIVVVFADQYPGINITVLSMTICMMVFVALLTPAASPFCGMLHARRDLVTYGELMKLFLPMIVIAIVLYTFVGYNIAKFLF